MLQRPSRKLIPQLILVFATLGAVVACAPTTDRRGTGEYVDDKALSARVKTAIIRDEGIRGATDINVETFRGVVQLSGFVENQDMINRAVARAREVDGVRSVQNALRVRTNQPNVQPRS